MHCIDKQGVSAKTVIDLVNRTKASTPLSLSDEWIADAGKHLAELKAYLAN